MQTAQDAAAVVIEKYPRVARSKPVQLLVWVACPSLLVCGVVTFIFACIQYQNLTHVFIGFYFILFGIMAVTTELRLGFAQRLYGFLSTKLGLGLFFIFAGTLGLSFGIQESVGVLVPFIAGICWAVVGVVSITDTAIMEKCTRRAPDMIETVT